MKYFIAILNIIYLFFLYKRQGYLLKWGAIAQTPVYFQEDMSPYLSLEKPLFNDKRFLKHYILKLLVTRQFEKADSFLNIVQRYTIDSKLFLYQGRVKLALGDTCAAIEQYTAALYLVPNRFIPKSRLMEIFLAQKDTANAEVLARLIWEADVKVRSPTIDTLKQQVLSLFPHLKKI